MIQADIYCIYVTCRDWVLSFWLPDLHKEHEQKMQFRELMKEKICIKCTHSIHFESYTV